VNVAIETEEARQSGESGLSSSRFRELNLTEGNLCSVITRPILIECFGANGFFIKGTVDARDPS